MRRWLLATAFVCAACAGQPYDIEDSIADVPADQQVTIMRRTIEQQWPLTVGKGTLGCRSGAVVFRTGGRTYAVNDAARGQGFAPIDAIRAPTPTPRPSNPLKGKTQDERQRMFAELAACGPTETNLSSDCTRQVSTRYHVTDADLAQIRAEGRERSWPPLRREMADMQPLSDRGLKLCKR